MASADAPVRARAFGQDRRPSPVDALGVWLSTRRVRRSAPSLDGARLGDFGCGYHATWVRPVLDRLASAVLVDVALADDLKAHPKVTGLEGALPAVLGRVPDASLDVVTCLNVLEHLWDPAAVLAECRRVVVPGGVCLFNVPSWLGKRALELSAFRLGLSPAEEMDDHKAYYDPSDLWPLLVRAGFVPHNIRCFRHKLGMNTFAVCRVDPGRPAT
ncbi:MAG TPA: methyltransferase domain-containing protein [Acidimicrobiales bacterium]|nr:methyltransferase domain-containing protein [Acidimicrobiales bacterium]